MRKITLLLLALIPMILSAQDVYKRGFSWGIDIGSSIDMTGKNISTIDAEAYFGMRSGTIRNLCVGGGIHTSLGNSNTLMPVFLMFRTSFTSRPSLCFLELKGGYSFNTLIGDESQQGPFGSAGLGFNLYTGNKFRSHLILSYHYFKMESYENGEEFIPLTDLHSASIKIGISF